MHRPPRALVRPALLARLLHCRKRVQGQVRAVVGPVRAGRSAGRGGQEGAGGLGQGGADPAVVQVMEKAGSPMAYLHAPELQSCWRTDAGAMTEAARKIGKVE